jgi:cation transport regulator
MEDTMPTKYDKISDLPQSQVDQYDHHQKQAFLKAYNHAVDEYHDESKAFAVAHHAAKQAGHKENG